MRVLHIGQRKTGSTWLQAGAGVADKAGVLRYCHRALMDASAGLDMRSSNRAQFEAVASALPRETGRPVFASLETLVTLDQTILATAVQQVWPDAQVLVTTRGPLGYLRSSFNNHAINGGTSTADAFAKRFGRHMLRSHDLDGIAAAWDKAFGPGRITFVPFELLRDSQETYLATIGKIVGVSLAEHMPNEARHPSPPPRYLAMLREINALIEKEAPAVLKSKIWSRFVKTANAAVALAPQVGALAEDNKREPRKAEKLPDLPEGMLASLAKRMAVLRDLPQYQPYLAHYGLAPEGTT